ncbi:hypothetical protein bcgnr5414_63850 [Bacillus cereus]
MLDKHQFHSLKLYNYVVIKSDTPSEQRKHIKKILDSITGRMFNDSLLVFKK